MISLQENVSFEHVKLYHGTTTQFQVGYFTTTTKCLVKAIDHSAEFVIWVFKVGLKSDHGLDTDQIL